jgi:small-conductance mechanosensitive channel
MEAQLTVWFQQSVVFLIPATVFLAILLAGYALRRYLFSRLSRWAVRTGSRTSDAILTAVKSPFTVLSVMLGLYAALGVSDLPRAWVDRADKTLGILAIVAVSLMAANLLSGLTRTRADRGETALPVTSLTEHIIRIVVYGMGFLIILNSLGVSIAPILATLGVGGLAVALALQSTLSNFFAGFHIIVTGQIRVGDFLRLENGDEGYVTDISWRTTKVETLAGNLILIPNAKLTEMIVTNYSLQDKHLAVRVGIGVHYGSDLEQVERVAIEVAAEVMREVPGGDPEFEPRVRFHTFNDSSIDLTVIMRANDFVDQYLLKHEFIKRIHKRFAREGIVIPYPIRAINTDQEKKG